MSKDNIIPIRRTILDPGGEPFASTSTSSTTAVAQPAITVASTAVALTMPSTIHVHALVPLDQPLPDAMQLILTNWRKTQMRKAIAALLALHPNGPPIGRGTQQLVSAVIAFCKDPEREMMPPPGDRTIKDAIRIVWPWLPPR